MSSGLQFFSILFGAMVAMITVAALIANALKSNREQRMLPTCKEKFRAIEGRINSSDGDSKKVRNDIDSLESKISSTSMAIGLRVNDLESESRHQGAALEKIEKLVARMDHNIVRLMVAAGLKE